MSTNDVAVIAEPSWVEASGNWASPGTETFALKVALTHDWLPGMRSVEKVLERSCDMFPDASLWTLAEILTFDRLLRNLVAAAGECA